MAESDPSKAPLNLEQEVDLLQYLHALLAVKYRILIAAIIVAIGVFGLSKSINDIYSAAVVLAININENPGGVRQGDYRGSDVIGLIEHDFIIDSVADNEKDRLIARMTSSAFIELFISENSLMEYIFHDQWNHSKRKWNDGFEPSMLLAIQFFKQKMFAPYLDEGTGLLTIYVNTRSPELSATLANRFWKRFNDYFKGIELEELERRRAYLDQRLDEVNNLEMQRSIFRLKETQLAAEALLYGRTSYPLEEIETAAPPLNKSYPNRKVWAVLAFIGTLFLGITVVILRIIVVNLMLALKKYDPSEGAKSTVNQNNHSSDIKDSAIIAQPQPQPHQGATLEGKDIKSTYDEWIDRP